MYYGMIALMLLITGQLSKLISFKQALNIPFGSEDYYLCFLAGLIIVVLTVGIRAVVERELLAELKM